MDTETRISLLEHDMTSVKADLAAIRANYATKEDVQAIRAELQALRRELKAEIQELREELRADMKELRADMLALRTDLEKEINAVARKFIGSVLTIIHAWPPRITSPATSIEDPMNSDAAKRCAQRRASAPTSSARKLSASLSSTPLTYLWPSMPPKDFVSSTASLITTR
jgi:hypothetical protein